MRLAGRLCPGASIAPLLDVWPFSASGGRHTAPPAALPAIMQSQHPAFFGLLLHLSSVLHRPGYQTSLSDTACESVSAYLCLVRRSTARRSASTWIAYSASHRRTARELASNSDASAPSTGRDCASWGTCSPLRRRKPGRRRVDQLLTPVQMVVKLAVKARRTYNKSRRPPRGPARGTPPSTARNSSARPSPGSRR